MFSFCDCVGFDSFYHLFKIERTKTKNESEQKQLETKQKNDRETKRLFYDDNKILPLHLSILNSFSPVLSSVYINFKGTKDYVLCCLEVISKHLKNIKHVSILFESCELNVNFNSCFNFTSISPSLIYKEESEKFASIIQKWITNLITFFF